MAKTTEKPAPFLIPMPEHLVRHDWHGNIITFREHDTLGWSWGHFRPIGAEWSVYAQICQGCRGDVVTNAAPARFCPWCGTELDYMQAEKVA